MAFDHVSAVGVEDNRYEHALGGDVSFQGRVSSSLSGGSTCQRPAVTVSPLPPAGRPAPGGPTARPGPAARSANLPAAGVSFRSPGTAASSSGRSAG